jgi:hypothetical protein
MRNDARKQDLARLFSGLTGFKIKRIRNRFNPAALGGLTMLSIAVVSGI